METKQYRVCPEAIEYFEALEELGFAFGARDKWSQFLDAMPEDGEAAQEARGLMDDLQTALVYTDGYEPVHWQDLSWTSIGEMKTAMAPKVQPPEQPAVSWEAEPEQAIITEGELDRVAVASNSDGDDVEALKLKSLRMALEQRKVDVPDLSEKMGEVTAAAQEKDLPVSVLNVITSRASRLKLAIERTDRILAADASAMDLNSILDEWQELRDDITGLYEDILQSEDLLIPVEVKFPFDSPREGQLEAAVATRDALINSDAIVLAPTGFGKSALVAAAVSGFKAGAYIVTPQKVLVEQYKGDFEQTVEWIGFLKARGDFKCVCSAAKTRRKNLSEDEWPTCSDMATGCDITVSKEDKHKCPYVKQRDEAMSKPVVVMTAAMATTLMLYQAHRFPKRAVIAVDESQRFEETLMSACTTMLSFSALIKDGWTMESDPDDPDNTLKWPATHHMNDQHAVKEWVRIWLRRAINRLDAMSPADLQGSELKQYRRYFSLCGSLQMAFKFDNPSLPQNKVRPHTWIHERGNEQYKKPEQMVIKPLSAQGMFDDIMGGAAARKLLVSATPGTVEYVQATLGMKYKPQYLEFGTPFPPKNRELVYLPTVKLNYKSKPTDYDKIMETICMLAESADPGGRRDHVNQKGVIHTVSNKLHNQIVDALGDRGMRWRVRELRGSFKRQETLAEFQRSSEPLILLGPAITDGVSLKDDQCRWGIIPKIPWAPPEPSVVWRRDNIQDWYAFQAIMSIIQACGRNVRSKDDWATNYILDSGFSSVLSRNGHLFPSWFAEAVVDLS